MKALGRHLLIFLFGILLSGCEGADATHPLNVQFKNLSEWKQELLDWKSTRPWEAVSAYVEFWPKYQAATAEWLATIQATGPRVFCQNLFLDSRQWSQIQERCTRGEFFLCHPSAEKPASVFASWWNAQTPEFHEIWDRSSECQKFSQEWLAH